MRACSYVLGELDRTVSPEHYNYQVRLKKFLESRKIQAQFEKDFIDVMFSIGASDFIGEVKVTGWLRIDQAFRAALGQLLDYAHTRCSGPIGLVMFLDKDLDPRRLELASNLGIAVVVERADRFVL